MSDKKKEFLESLEKSDGKWLKDAKYRRANRDWLRKSQSIALRILDVLDEKDMQQKELADAMEVSPQQISKIVKGKQNLTLETIAKLEAVLGTTLTEVPKRQFEMKIEPAKSLKTNFGKSKKQVFSKKQDLFAASRDSWNPSETHLRLVS